MADSVSVTAKIQVTLEVNWNHSFGEGATALDIYTTAARECKLGLEQALKSAGIRYSLIGEITPLMVILPVKSRSN